VLWVSDDEAESESVSELESESEDEESDEDEDASSIARRCSIMSFGAFCRQKVSYNHSKLKTTVMSRTFSHSLISSVKTPKPMLVK
jgi:hypothetical protein